MAFYAPMHPNVWHSRIEFLRQSIANARDDLEAKPDISLLSGGEHGPFTSIHIGTDPLSGLHNVFFTVKNLQRQPRWVSPELFLVIELVLAFGGGLSPNDTGKGLGYVKLFSGRDGISLLRLMTDAGAGEIAKQHSTSGERTDYHNLNIEWASKAPARQEGREGKRSRFPHRGRREVIETALRYFHENRMQPRPSICEADFAFALREAFWLLDYKRIQAGGRSK